MGYVHKVIGADEKLILVTRLHWIYPLEGLIFFALTTVLGVFINDIMWVNAGYLLPDFEIDLHFISIKYSFYMMIPLAFGLIGFLMFWSLFTSYISTEIGLTNHRIIYKKGLFLIDVQQVELEDIRGEEINHGWLGWILGYGKIRFDCRFIDDVYLPATKNPYRLIKAVHTARMRHEKIAYNMDDLSLDIERVDNARVKAFKSRERLNKIGRKVKRDFNTKH